MIPLALLTAKTKPRGPWDLSINHLCCKHWLLFGVICYSRKLILTFDGGILSAVAA